MAIDKVKISTISKYMISPIENYLNIDSVAAEGKEKFENYIYRMKSSNYRGDSDPSIDTLLKNISEAIKRSIGDKRVLLLLSDGKDSMSLAVALANLNIKCETLTLLRTDDIELKSFVEEKAYELGHTPHFIDSNTILDSFDINYFLDACSKMNQPVMDQGFIYFLFGLKTFFEKKSLNVDEYVVLDGLGNDETFGYIPSSTQLKSYYLSRFGLWKLIPKHLNFLKWFLRSPAESHGDLSALGCVFKFPYSFNINKYFSLISNSNDPENIIDFRAYSRGSFHDHQCMMAKASISCEQIGTSVEFPWLDKQLAEYTFNLPVRSKYDFRKLENKLLLRQLLVNNISWSQSKRGVDLYFDLDYELFLDNTLGSMISTAHRDELTTSKLPNYVKKRAALELVNLYGYCLSKGMKQKEINDLIG
ncbi:hypothetical protein A6E01_17245 [Vibrio breoganii]|uniref:Asparagine synthetase domain-containing protein n=1 Tax=Vibrio breoganii TaxID=553239 RepID=A0AAN0XYQ2_9VIBR|nr:asparagine synthase-related protein [Vibrio breoganii]ANO34929.1 hypothetical protein A6E01_17245 [Vibrio breoganii]